MEEFKRTGGVGVSGAKEGDFSEVFTNGDTRDARIID